MIVYHSSFTIITNPDVKYSRNKTDFSKGFYLTTNKDQAKVWAKRRISDYEISYINEYELNEKELKKLKVLKFNSYDKKWLDFVCKCRVNQDDSDYDVVIGPVADDKVYDTINLYFERLININEAIKRLKKKEANNQICIRNNEAIDLLLTFVKGERYNG